MSLWFFSLQPVFAQSVPADPFCEAVHQFIEAGRTDFTPIQGNAEKSFLTWHKSTITLPGTIDAVCKILPGALGNFVTCSMSQVVERSPADTRFAEIRTKLDSCHLGWTMTEQSNPTAQEMMVRWKESSDVSRSVQLQLKNRGEGLFQVQVWFYGKEL